METTLPPMLSEDMKKALRTAGRNVEKWTAERDTPARRASRGVSQSRAARPPAFPGTGVEVCECGQHRQRCKFGQWHSWSLASVNPATGIPLDTPAFHCFTCDSWCAIPADEF